jgi:hypothetical protein
MTLISVSVFSGELQVFSFAFFPCVFQPEILFPKIGSLLGGGDANPHGLFSSLSP